MPDEARPGDGIHPSHVTADNDSQKQDESSVSATNARKQRRQELRDELYVPLPSLVSPRDLGISDEKFGQLIDESQRRWEEKQQSRSATTREEPNMLMSIVKFIISLIVLPVIMMIAAAIPEFVLRIVLVIPGNKRTFREDVASIVGGISGGWLAMLHTMIWYEHFFGRPVVFLPVVVMFACWTCTLANAEHLTENGHHCNPHWAISLAMGFTIGFLIFGRRYLS